MTRDLAEIKTKGVREITPAEEFVKRVYSNLNDIKKSFFAVGYLLYDASRKGYYRELGYDTIVECAEDLFDFKKTTTYDLMNIYSRFYDRKAPLQLQKSVENFSQSQLVVISKLQYCSDSFIELTRPEDTIETVRRAKNLWNKIYNKGCSPKGNYKTLTEFLEINEPIYNSRPVTSEEKTTDFSGYPENIIEVTAVDAAPQEEGPNDPLGDFSKEKEKLGQFCNEAILHFLKIMDFSIGFGGDKKTPGTRVVPSFFTEEILRALARAIEKDRTKVKHIITNFMVDRLGTFEYEITLYGRKQNFAVFCGTLAGTLTDYLIKEFKGKEEKK